METKENKKLVEGYSEEGEEWDDNKTSEIRGFQIDKT